MRRESLGNRKKLRSSHLAAPHPAYASGHTQSASWMSSTDLMKCVWPRMKLMASGFAIWTAENLGSIAIANLLHLGVRSSRLHVSCQSVQGSGPTPKKSHVCCLPCCRQKTATRPAQKSFLHKVFRLPKFRRGLRCLPRETQSFTWAYGKQSEMPAKLS